MVFSEYLKAAKQAVSHVQGKVRYRGLNTPGGWIRNPLEAQQKFLARVGIMAMDIATRMDYEKRSAGWDTFIDEWYRQAIATNTGNCCELSAVAYKYLIGQGIKPVEYFGVYRGSWNHAFVVLNRDQNIPVSDFAAWSRLAVVCDPLLYLTSRSG